MSGFSAASESNNGFETVSSSERASVFTTWRVMFGNGVLIGMTRITTKVLLAVIRRARCQVSIASCAAAAGTTTPGNYDHPTASVFRVYMALRAYSNIFTVFIFL